MEYHHDPTENLSSEVSVVTISGPRMISADASLHISCDVHTLLNETVPTAAKSFLFARRRRAQILRHFGKK